MEKLLNNYDKEYLKMAMLKHEETFRDQVYELHRLYRIQKVLMNDIAKNNRYTTTCRRPEARLCLDLERPAGSGDMLRVSEGEDDQNDLELTLGPKSYYTKKIKAAGPGLGSDSGPSFSSSSSGSGHMKGPEMPVLANKDRLNSSPWLFQALSLNIT
ncbi:quinoprotein amine dehydrogenase [Striga asiatica]|uniref:Quinoprotein amine dehydrogenase n=1 Tax=Striga asiatica TaxID=4170 RepID=A0A5A7PE33_STRAF|nr:quinoprotein amine dehydrogenase [Striga asiatica]